MNSLVKTEWLSRYLDDPYLILLDCSVSTMPEEEGGVHNVSGLPDYEAGHIPSAGFTDLKAELSDLNQPIEFAV